MSVPTPLPGGGDVPAQARRARAGMLELLDGLDPEATAWARQVAADAPDKPSVVVLGETKRGKSSLVNAVLGEPNLSPVGAELATATYLAFDHAESWRARVCQPHGEPVPIALAELAGWMSPAHRPGRGAGAVGHIEVRGPCPMLERLVLVDTPGVGGLHFRHGQRAAEAAAAATAVVFVVDASAPLGASELSFLSSVTGSIETVLFVLTKTDAYRGWREVHQANQELLARHAPRFADAEWHAVSARLFETAAAAPDAQIAATLRERSGIAALQVRAQELVLGRAAALAEANALRAVLTVLGEQRGALHERHSALSAGGDTAGQLRERRAELAAQRRTSTKGWQLRLRSEMQRARLECSHEVGNQMREAQSSFRGRIDVAGAEELAELPGELDAALHEVSAALTGLLGRRLSAVTEAVLAELFSPAELQVVRAQFARDGPHQLTVRGPDKRQATAEDSLLVFMGVTGGVGAGKIVALPLVGMSLFTPVVLPAALAVGLGAGWWLARTRRRAASKQHLKQWLAEAIAEARSTMDQLVSEQMIDAEQQLSMALDEATDNRVAALDAELAEVDTALRLGAAERSRKLGEISGTLGEVRSAYERAEALLARLRSVRA